MNKKYRGYNAYFILVLLLLALLVIPSLLDNDQVEYTRGELVQDLEEDNVIFAGIAPNRQTPTGEVNIILRNGQSRTLYATDVREMEELLISHGIDPEVRKVQEESWFLTSVFPVLLAIIVMVFFFVMMNSQNAGGSNKMMNFGKSRARLSVRQGHFKGCGGAEGRKGRAGRDCGVPKGACQVHQGRGQDSQGRAS